jgi:hypothetical protein
MASRAGSRGSSPEGRVMSVLPSSPFLMSVALVPAERQSWPPCPGRNSMLCMIVPVGKSLSILDDPGLTEAVSFVVTMSPTPRPSGASTYAYCSVLDASAPQWEV